MILHGHAIHNGSGFVFGSEEAGAISEDTAQNLYGNSVAAKVRAAFHARGIV
ncbi:MAG: hypothetical protein ACXVE1_05350 [Gaiellaceae bacterium]